MTLKTNQLVLAKNKSVSVHQKAFSYQQLRSLNLKLDCCLNWWMISSFLRKDLIIWGAIMHWKKTRSYYLSLFRESFLLLLPNCGIFYQKILRLSRNSKQKLILVQLTTALPEYVRNILGEEDSFKSFHRFWAFGFVIHLLDDLGIIFLSCTSFRGTFLEIIQLVFHSTIWDF